MKKYLLIFILASLNVLKCASQNTDIRIEIERMHSYTQDTVKICLPFQNISDLDSISGESFIYNFEDYKIFGFLSFSDSVYCIYSLFEFNGSVFDNSSIPKDGLVSTPLSLLLYSKKFRIYFLYNYFYNFSFITYANGLVNQHDLKRQNPLATICNVDSKFNPIHQIRFNESDVNKIENEYFFVYSDNTVQRISVQSSSNVTYIKKTDIANLTCYINAVDYLDFVEAFNSITY